MDELEALDMMDMEEFEEEDMFGLGEVEEEDMFGLGEVEEEDMFGLGEFDGYGDFEGDLFFGKLWRGIKRVARGVSKWVVRGAKALGKVLGPIFKKLAPIASRIVGGVIGGPAGAAIGGSIAQAVLREADYESEAEAEAELLESDADFEAQGGDFEAYELMEDFAAEAVEAESEAEADMFIGRMALQAAQMFRRNPRLRGAVPRVIRAAMALAKTFRVNKRTRWAIRTIPVIIKRTLTRLGRLRRVTRRSIVEAMAHETAWVLANRRRALVALRHHQMVRRRGPVRRGPVRRVKVRSRIATPRLSARCQPVRGRITRPQIRVR